MLEIIAGLILISGVVWWLIRISNDGMVGKAKNFQEVLKALDTMAERNEKEAKPRTSKPSSDS